MYKPAEGTSKQSEAGAAGDDIFPKLIRDVNVQDRAHAVHAVTAAAQALCCHGLLPRMEPLPEPHPGPLQRLHRGNHLQGATASYLACIY